jgi:hypothetical protein
LPSLLARGDDTASWPGQVCGPGGMQGPGGLGTQLQVAPPRDLGRCGASGPKGPPRTRRTGPPGLGQRPTPAPRLPRTPAPGREARPGGQLRLPAGTHVGGVTRPPRRAVADRDRAERGSATPNVPNDPAGPQPRRHPAAGLTSLRTFSNE